MTSPKPVLATLAYHDIFDYPLKVEEIHRFLIGKPVALNRVRKTVQMLLNLKKIGIKQDYYFLSGHPQIVNLRTIRKRYSRSKFKKADFFGRILKVVPTVKMVAVSGALAMANSHQKDDIDLVIVSSEGLLWTTRFLAYMFLLFFKRDPAGQKISDRACLNLFFDESQLKILNRNLYTAHEIAQMKPLWDRDDTYNKFIKANKWIKKYLPNWAPSSEIIDHRSLSKSLLTTNYLLRTVESFLKNLQLWYMRPKITSEKIGTGQLFFHPADTQTGVLTKYRERLKKLGIKFSS